MTYREKSGKYEVCRNCGAHLDHGERCDCGEAAAGKEGTTYGEGMCKRGTGM